MIALGLEKTIDLFLDLGKELIIKGVKTIQERRKIKESLENFLKQYQQNENNKSKNGGNINYEVLLSYFLGDGHEMLLQIISLKYHYVNRSEIIKKLISEATERAKISTDVELCKQEIGLIVKNFINLLREFYFEQLPLETQVVFQYMIDEIKPIDSKELETQEINYELTWRVAGFDNNILGRDDLLKEIEEKLKSGQKSLLINGLGGIGKTAVAKEFFSEVLQKKFPSHYYGWIDVSQALNKNRVSLTESIYNALNPTGDSSISLNLEQKEQSLLEKLNKHKDTILIIDGLDIMTDDDKSLLCKISGCTGTWLIVTSRMERMDGFKTITTEFLDKEICAKVFWQYYRYDSDSVTFPNDMLDTLLELSELAGYHTLIIEEMARTARELDDNPRVFLEKLRRDPAFKFLKDEIRVWTEHDGCDKSLTKSLASLFELKEFSVSQKQLCRCLSIFAGLTLPVEIKRWIGASNLDWQILVRRGIIHKNPVSSGSYKMYPIVGRSLEQQNEAVTDADCAKLLKYIRWGNKVLDESLPSELYTNRLAIIQALHEKFGTAHVIYSADICMALAEGYFHTANYKKAIEQCNVAKDIYANSREESVENEINKAGIIHTIANNLEELGNYKDANQFYEEALEIRLANNSDHKLDLEIARSYNNLGNNYRNLGNYEQSIKYYIEALQIRENSSENIKSTATTYNCLAMLLYEKFHDQCDYRQGLDYLEKANNILKSFEGESSIYIASTYNNKALLYGKLGDFDKALELASRALEIRLKLLDACHPSTARAHVTMGKILRLKGEYDAALASYKKALDIQEKVLDKSHPDTTAIYYDEALLFYEQAEENKALSLFIESYNAFNGTFGKDNDKTIDALMHARLIYAKLNPNTPANFDDWLEHGVVA